MSDIDNEPFFEQLKSQEMGYIPSKLPVVASPINQSSAYWRCHFCGNPGQTHANCECCGAGKSIEVDNDIRKNKDDKVA